MSELADIDADRLSANDDLPAVLDLDSLATLRMLAMLEQNFGVHFDDGQLGELRTLNRLLDALEQAQPREGLV